MPPMMRTSPPQYQPHEQRKVELLLLKLATIQPISAKPVQPASEERVKTASFGHA